MINWICGATGISVQSETLPEGWVIPDKDISNDLPKEPLPKGTVVALSSKAALGDIIQSRIEENTNNSKG